MPSLPGAPAASPTLDAGSTGFVATPTSPPSTGSAVVARAVLAGGALLALASAAWALRAEPFPWALHTSAFAASTCMLAAALAVGAAKPRAVALRLRAPRLPTGAGLAAYALVAIALWYVFGLSVAVENAGLWEQLQGGAGPADLVPKVSRDALLGSLAVSFLVFVLPTLAWAFGAEALPKPLSWLGLHARNAGASLGMGGASLLAAYLFLILAGVALHLSGAPEPQNPVADAIAGVLNVPLALLVALLSATGEEIFFRGLLLRKIGNVPQALLFAAAHLNYLQGIEVVVTGILGFAFGRTVQKSGNLIGAIAAHATFNAITLLILLFAKSGGALAIFPPS